MEFIYYYHRRYFYSHECINKIVMKTVIVSDEIKN